MKGVQREQEQGESSGWRAQGQVSLASSGGLLDLQLGLVVTVAGNAGLPSRGRLDVLLFKEDLLHCSSVAGPDEKRKSTVLKSLL